MPRISSKITTSSPATSPRGRSLNKSRFVYASSAATYGDGAQGMEDNEAALDTLRPLNMYGYSKHLFDLHAKRAGFLNKIVGLKYFNVFGPNEDHKGDMRSLVHKSFAQVQSKGVIQLFKSYRKDYKDGESKRDFLYVKDCVAMTLHLAATPKANGLFNIGSGGARSWIDLANAVFVALKKKRASSSSRCLKRSVTSISISRRQTCCGCAARATSRRSRHSKMR